MRYNIAPSQIAFIIRLDDAGRLQCELTRWGLIPHWAKIQKIGSHIINARIETASSKPAFRDAWKRRRCMVPATGFHEWKVQAGKHPSTIITTDADDFMKPIHERMPVMVPTDRIDGWLRYAQIRGELRPGRHGDVSGWHLRQQFVETRTWVCDEREL